MDIPTKTKNHEGGAHGPLATAEALAPLLTEQAAINEDLGRLSDATMDALLSAGLIGMWLPRSLGGLELGPVGHN